MTTMPTPSSTSMSRNARIWRVVDPQVVTVARVGRDPRPWMRTQTLTSRLDTSRPAQRGRTTSIGGTSLAVGHRVAYWATPQPDRPAGGTSGRGNDHEVLIRVLTGNIRPCFSRRPDEPSTALHHHLANRDHWHHKETGLTEALPSSRPASPESDDRPTRATPFPHRPRPCPKTCEGCTGPGSWARCGRLAMHCVHADHGPDVAGHTRGTRLGGSLQWTHRLYPRTNRPSQCARETIERPSQFHRPSSRSCALSTCWKKLMH